MKNVFSILCIVVLLPNAQATAREGAFGAGGFFDFYIPVFNFKDMYDSGTKFGGTAHYIYHKRKMVEVEFHHARFNNGSLETRTFSFSDGKEYTSPQAEANMTINSINANWLFALREQGFGQGTTLYLTFGAGLHDYSSKVSGLIFAGQTPSGAGAPPDPTILLEPINDTRTAFSASFGGGVQIGMGDKAALDLRARYNIVMGELRPFLVWGIEKTYPFNLIDIGAGIKFNLN
ncbi:MAG: outer membrane beta-barrel protein [Gemmatimonadota bacterium]|nr:outer membrane beta-barrel protein [Gemmatimonadota bacterium]